MEILFFITSTIAMVCIIYILMSIFYKNWNIKKRKLYEENFIMYFIFFIILLLTTGFLYKV